jgi:predicted  nucleic acid-binding Zn-ribbon protein
MYRLMNRRERLDAAGRRLADAQGHSEDVRRRAREINEQLWDLRWRLFQARRELADVEHGIEEALREALGDEPERQGHERNGRPVR